MLITSDLHIHSEHSYDAKNTVEEICEGARAQGLVRIGITDHLNFNDEKFLGDLRRSAEGVGEAQKKYPFLLLGVELTPIERPEFLYIAKHGTREGYVAPVQDKPFDIELALTKEELMALGVRYAVGGAHWRVDVPNGRQLPVDFDKTVREFYRQQMFLACDERVTILAHPWYHGKQIWYENFDLIPRSMKTDIGAALKENGKNVECNLHFFTIGRATERFRHQYAEHLREYFEMGIGVTFGSDSHSHYSDQRADAEKYLRAAGFVEGDFKTLAESDLWF